MDKKSLLILEFDKIREQLSSYTSFSAGQERARNLHPTTDPQLAELRQTETAEADILLARRTDIRIGGARDIRQAVDNAYRGFVLPVDSFRDIQATIIAGRDLRRKLEKVDEEFPTLYQISQQLSHCPGLVDTISQTIDERGDILDSASPELAKIRSKMIVVHNRIQDKLRNYINGPTSKYLQEPIITRRNGRYVIPLRAEHNGRIKGIVHDQSGSGATLWIEPFPTVDANNEYRTLHLDEKEEINRILAALTRQVAEFGEDLKTLVDTLAELDLIFARAHYAHQLKATRPQFMPWRPPAKPPKHANQRQNWEPDPHPGSIFWVKAARHPLLDPHTVVPTDLTLNKETFLVLITGPNTGGKTVSLKTAGLMVIMAQSGLHLPAQEARLTIFDNVLADIGDEQSIEQSLSTFSSHITNIIRILDIATDKSLLLLDELGSGTDPAEGAALAQALINFFRDKGITTFTATHYPELKAYASNTKGATNASLIFDVDTLSPTYEMTIGLPGRSNAIAIARRLGLDETILDDALEQLGSGNEHAGAMLDSIYDLRDKINASEAAARLAQKRAEQLEDELAEERHKIAEERHAILTQARQDAQAELDALQDEITQIRRQIKRGSRSDLSQNKLKQINKNVTEMVEDNPPLPPLNEPETTASKQKRRKLRQGDTVFIKSIKTQGQILSLQGKEAEVAVGRLHMRAQISDLEFKGRDIEEEQLPSPPTKSAPRAASPGMELDLRGATTADGVDRLSKYLDSAYLAQLPWVRIIHGKGTGKLREAVRDALTHSRYVRKWENGRTGEGGDGVTIARLDEES
ncbi:MAG TPA: endonuclease MutS2 [Anaerolineae bacterium]|nr:endonuclease MutS2 [Anaerolineae bacterium]